MKSFAVAGCKILSFTSWQTEGAQSYSLKQCRTPLSGPISLLNQTQCKQVTHIAGTGNRAHSSQDGTPVPHSVKYLHIPYSVVGTFYVDKN